MLYILCLFAISLLFSPDAFAQSRRVSGAHLKRGDLLMSKNKVAEALDSYDKAVEAEPGWAAAYVKRGMARRAKGDLEGSIEDYEKAEGLDPRSTADSAFVAESYSNRGLNRLQRLETASAVADFTKAIEHDGKEPTHFLRRGQAHLVEEELEAAVADFDRATALNRGNEFLTTLILIHRGFAFLLQGRQDEAKKDFDKSRQLTSGKQVELRLYLLGIEAQIKERRRRRENSMKGITE
jgi:tetratricopeptide (TPR) repeat protein